MDIERDLGADVIMAFDHCPDDPTDRAKVQDATDRTHRWLDRCVARWRENGGLDRGQALFGIVQGGVFEDIRRSVDAVVGPTWSASRWVASASVRTGRTSAAPSR